MLKAEEDSSSSDDEIPLSKIKKTPLKMPQIKEEPSLEEKISLESESEFESVVSIVEDADDVSENSGIALETEEVAVETKKNMRNIFMGKKSRGRSSKLQSNSKTESAGGGSDDADYSPEDIAIPVK